ncbi:PEP-CTERM sorting domain-containing protein [Stieleria sp. JC731]|uniref:PA14 domain-containing protein n=1 Tax=Pirellulaceae TaxID=2691357 RepID=UPI001E358EF8|nr:PA14 domain-containing protein [Stieleria sp. JC731]MCC9603737.1 PEP-CTERM sorting domain-containing protein [Stieleria sp. JC731]
MNLNRISIATLAVVLFSSPAFSGLLVEQFEVSTSVPNLVTANAIITSNAPAISGVFGVIDFADNPGDASAGDFAGFSPFPNSDGASPFSERNERFVVRVSGQVFAPDDGLYTFRTFNDDGLSLDIGGTSVIFDDQLHAVDLRTGSLSLAAGWHDLSLVFFEQGGGAVLELAGFGPNGSNQLLGAPGGLQTRPSAIGAVPEPGSLAVFGLGMLLAVAQARCM